MHPFIGRRAFIASAAAIGATALLPGKVRGRERKTRLILLSTGGGRRPRKASSAPAQVIVSSDAAYVVDCGNGVARQLAFAGVPLTSLRHVFITHHHSDHTADYGNLIWLAWTGGLRTRVDAWGPPPLKKMTRLFLEMNAKDIETRIADEGRVPLAPLIHVHELNRAGAVMEDDHLKVTAALVHHPPVVPSFRYRFDAADLLEIRSAHKRLRPHLHGARGILPSWPFSRTSGGGSATTASSGCCASTPPTSGRGYR